MHDYRFSNGIIYDYFGDKRDLFVPERIDGEPVIEIHDHAFDNKQLLSLTLPETLEVIGEAAFLDNFIDSLIVPPNVHTIHASAFENNEIAELTLPEGLLTIADYAFQNNHLTGLKLPNSLQTLGQSAFYKNKIESLTLGNQLTRIPKNAFRENFIPSVKLPDSIQVVEEWAFNHNKIRQLSLNQGLQQLQTNVFTQNDLSFALIPTSITDLHQQAFDRAVTLDQPAQHADFHITNGHITSYSGTQTNLIIPPAIDGETIHTIDAYAFNGLNLTNIFLPNTIQTILTSAFSYNNLTTLILPTSLKHIAEGAFSDNQLTSVQLNPKLHTIEKNAFINNPLEEIVIPESVLHGNASAFDPHVLITGKHIDKAGFKFFNGTLHGYYGRETEIIIPEKINGKKPLIIGDHAFDGLPIKTITLPAGIKRIRQTAFSDDLPLPEIIRQ